MKKTILLFLTFLTYQFTFSQCHYVVDMQDSYGDGWNGAQINVSINSILITSFTVPSGGSSAIDSISTYTGDNVSFDFVSGTWDTEITYTITAPDGSTVGSYGPYPTNSGNDGPIWSGVSNSTCAPPACLDPYGLVITGTTSSSVDLSWTAGPNAGSYTVEYGTSGFAQGSGSTTTSTTTTAAISGLTSYTMYDFYVQSDCQASGNGTSNFTGPISVSTCPGAAPYLETFDPGMAPCWIQDQNDIFDWTLNAGTTASNPTGPSDDITGGGNYIYIETSAPRAPGDSAILHTPAIDLTAVSVPQLKFYSHMFGASIAELRIDASTNGGTSYSNIFSKSGDQGDQWVEELVDLSSFSGSVEFKITAYVGDDGSGIQYWGDIAIDNFEIRNAPTCPKPNNVIISNLTSTGADFSWTPGGTEPSWNIEYGAAGFTLGTGTASTVTNTSYSASGLSSQTDYDFYVQADCGSGDLSNWEGPISFSTPPTCGDNFGPYCYGAGAFTVFTAVASTPGDFITLNITAGETEVGYDNLQIYDGVGNTGNLLYDADGDHSGVSILSTTGTITMYIDGDAIWNCVDGIGGPYVPIEATLTCTTPSAIDMAGMAVTTSPTLILANGPFVISGELQNMGLNTVTSMDINYAIDGGTAVTESVSGLNLGTGDIHPFNHSTSWSPTAAGTYDIAVWASNINSTNDMNNSNDTAYATVTVYDNATLKRPMLESFTSSTCGPCVAGNQNVSAITANYALDQYSILKYQMSWPGSGDPYYTQEGGDRRNYYSVNAVPDLVVDGNFWQDNSTALTAQVMDDALAIPAFVELSSFFTVDNQTVDINVNINPLGDFTNSLTLYVAIFEYMTYNNVGSNGETQFGYVMKKMVPGSSGFLLSPLQDGVPVNENFSYTFQGSYVLPPDANSPIDHSSSHSVEDFNNLGVVLWIQDDATKEIVQSAEAIPSSTGIDNHGVKNASLMVFPNPAQEFATLKINDQNANNGQIEITNSLGEIVYAKSIDVIGSSINIDLSTLSNGIYNISYKNSGVTLYKKLQVMK